MIIWVQSFLLPYLRAGARIYLCTFRCNAAVVLLETVEIKRMGRKSRKTYEICIRLPSICVVVDKQTKARLLRLSESELVIVYGHAHQVLKLPQRPLFGMEPEPAE
jgi:uncharacterized Fe-S cluster-containing radical SAM superfamily protein